MPLVQKGRQIGLQLEEKQVGKICMNSSHTETLVRGFTHGVQMRNGGPKDSVLLMIVAWHVHSKPHPNIVKTAIK